MTTLREIGERELIRRLARRLGTRDNVRVGIGDDVAVVAMENSPYDLLLTSDAVVEGTHFLADAPPAGIGRKAVGRGLSDLAAMGGEPLWALMDLVARPDTPVERIEELYRGAAAIAETYGLAIVGGDTTSGPALEIHVFAVGQVPKGSAVLRSGARPGDLVYVTGTLGGSLAGKHLSFEPRLEEGLWLRECGWAGSMIDVTDGLATDLGHILERSGVGAEVEASRVPVSEEARRAPGGRTPVEHALFDGEDFELVFTVAPEKQAAFESSWQDTFELPCARIGRITASSGRLDLLDGRGGRQALANGGYEHFSAGRGA